MMNDFSVGVQADGLLVTDVTVKVDDVIARLAACVGTQADGRVVYSAAHLPRLDAFVKAFNPATFVWEHSVVGVGQIVLSERQGRPDTRSAATSAPPFQLNACLAFVWDLCYCLIKSVYRRFPKRPILRALAVLHPNAYRTQEVANAEAPHRPLMPLFLVLVGHFVNGKVGEERATLFNMPGNDGGSVPSDGVPRVSGALTGQEKLVKEFISFVKVATLVARDSTCTPLSFWRNVAANHASSFPHMLSLAHAWLVMPAQTATVERGFSIHRTIKHRLTNRLKVATMDSLMRLRLLGPPAPSRSVPMSADSLPDYMTFHGYDEAQAVLESTGGMRSGKHPHLIGRLLDCACDIKLPTSLIDGVEDDEIPDVKGWSLGEDEWDGAAFHLLPEAAAPVAAVGSSRAPVSRSLQVELDDVQIYGAMLN
jgi:hypothetical protein